MSLQLLRVVRALVPYVRAPLAQKNVLRLATYCRRSVHEMRVQGSLQDGW
jgi:hypothetical protein